MERFVKMNGVNNSGVFSKFNNMTGGGYGKSILIFILLALFCLIAGFYVYNYLKSLKSNYQPNREIVYGNTGPNGSSQQSNPAELLFFYADWCPHCKSAKPIWEELQTEYENKTINGYKIIFTEINCSSDNAESEQMMNKYNVEGFPTIKLLKDGQVIEYDAKPSNATLVQFLNTVL